MKSVLWVNFYDVSNLIKRVSIPKPTCLAKGDPRPYIIEAGGFYIYSIDKITLIPKNCDVLSKSSTLIL